MPDVLGVPPVHPALVVLAKAGFLVSWGVLALRLAGINLLGPTVPGARAPAVLGLVVGLAVVTAALARLGRVARIGLPRDAESAALRTTGLYAYSRNPLYVGGLLICLASCLYVPHWLNFAATMATAAIHHLIVLSEERYLRSRFPREYAAYSSRVRRYL